MNEETREVLSRIPEEVMESLYEGDTYSAEFKRYETIGRYTTALLTTLQDATRAANEEIPYIGYYAAAVAVANEVPEDYTSISDDMLAELVYVIQPEDMEEQLSASQLASLFYAYCGALFKSEMITADNLRGVV